jgi:hypothetical protein
MAESADDPRLTLGDLRGFTEANPPESPLYVSIDGRLWPVRKLSRTGPSELDTVVIRPFENERMRLERERSDQDRAADTAEIADLKERLRLQTAESARLGRELEGARAAADRWATNSTSERDKEWILALAELLGTDSGRSVPLKPDAVVETMTPYIITPAAPPPPFDPMADPVLTIGRLGQLLADQLNEAPTNKNKVVRVQIGRDRRDLVCLMSGPDVVLCGRYKEPVAAAQPKDELPAVTVAEWMTDPETRARLRDYIREWAGGQRAPATPMDTATEALGALSRMLPFAFARPTFEPAAARDYPAHMPGPAFHASRRNPPEAINVLAADLGAVAAVLHRLAAVRNDAELLTIVTGIKDRWPPR